MPLSVCKYVSVSATSLPHSLHTCITFCARVRFSPAGVHATELPHCPRACITFCAFAHHSPVPCLLLLCNTSPTHASLSPHLHATRLRRVCYFFATHPPRMHHFLRTCTPLACAVSATSLPHTIHACITFWAFAHHSLAPCFLLRCHTASTHCTNACALAHHAYTRTQLWQPLAHLNANT